jgi:hypothetical protein
MMKRNWLRWGLLGWIAACSQADSGPAPLPYPLGQALVIGSGEDGTLAVVDDGCDSAECVAVREQCGSQAYADVLLDADGEVADVICLRSDVKVTEVGTEAIEGATVDNGTLLVLDGEEDGLDVTGDVVLSGNEAIVHGASAETALIGGNLILSGNGGIVREVTVQGDVIVDGNDAQLALVVVEGNLTIRGNNASLAEAVVFGELRIQGNDAVLVENQVQGEAALEGKNLTCNGNVVFADADADGVAEDTEVGAELVCPAAEEESDGDDESDGDESDGEDESDADDESEGDDESDEDDAQDADADAAESDDDGDDDAAEDKEDADEEKTDIDEPGDAEPQPEPDSNDP